MHDKSFANLSEDVINSIKHLENEIAAKHGNKVILLAFDPNK